MLLQSAYSWQTSVLSLLQAGPGRQVDDNIIIELQQRIRDLQEKLDSVGSHEVKDFLPWSWKKKP